jgi:putative ABC transport system substrate-binding protein
MRRRDFIAGLGSATAWPLMARAQNVGKVPVIGFLGTGTSSNWSPWVAAFGQRLRELGWIEEDKLVELDIVASDNTIGRVFKKNGNCPGCAP